MFDDSLRALKDRITFPIARVLGRFVSANTLTWTHFACGLLCSYAIVAGAGRDVALALWALNRLIDGFDGGAGLSVTAVL
jgi:phosphatidylglycerophosphate synthase